MGAWGPAVFSDDTALDVRTTYRSALEDGLSDEAARERVLTGFARALTDPDEGPVVWLALALTQWQLGRLDPETQREAVSIIDSGRGLARWQEQGGNAVLRCQAALVKVRAQLLAPQPQLRVVRRPTPKVTDLVPGDVLARRAADGTLTLWRVLELRTSREYVSPLLVPLAYSGQTLPDLDAIAQLADQPSRRLPQGRWFLHVTVPSKRRGHDWRDHGFAYVGRLPVRLTAYPLIVGYCGWDGLARLSESTPSPSRSG